MVALDRVVTCSTDCSSGEKVPLLTGASRQLSLFTHAGSQTRRGRRLLSVPLHVAVVRWLADDVHELASSRTVRNVFLHDVPKRETLDKLQLLDSTLLHLSTQNRHKFNNQLGPTLK